MKKAFLAYLVTWLIFLFFLAKFAFGNFNTFYGAV